MERLTTMWNDGSYDTFDPIDLVDNCYTKQNYKKVIKKLAEYEDLEEHGMLLRLPIRVEETVYLVDSCLRVVHLFEVKEICINKYETLFKIKYIGNDPQFFHWEIRTETSKIGEWIFLTKAEAEAALERMVRNEID